LNKDVGWIKLHRKILNSPTYLSLNSKQRDILISLLLIVNHKENKVIVDGKQIILKPGQTLTSLNKIKERCANDVSIKNIRTCLELLKEVEFLSWESTTKYRIITITNWQQYQMKENGSIDIKQNEMSEIEKRNLELMERERAGAL
jgi:DNA replication protein DnaD